MVDRHTPTQPVGLVGHSVGATVAARAVRKLTRIVGLFSIEGNLTAADAYLSGLATAFDGPDEYRHHLLDRVRTMAETADPGRSEALWRYHKALSVASPEALWRIGRGAAAASRMDGLGEAYRALPVPSLYYWSRANTPPQTQEYIQTYGLRNVEFTGGHWPMIEQPQATANAIAAFFQPRALATLALGRLELGWRGLATDSAAGAPLCRRTRPRGWGPDSGGRRSVPLG